MSWWNETMKELQGRTIHKIWLDRGNARLVFRTDDGVLVYDTWGDCCSHSWFNDLIGVDALIGGTVASVEHVDLPMPASDDAYDVLRDYGIKITTDKGVAQVVYRNSSNGYYGGECERYVGSFTLSDDAKQITEDWTA